MKKISLILFLVFNFSLGALECDIPGHFYFEVLDESGNFLYEGCYDAIHHGPHLIHYILTKEMVINDVIPKRVSFTTNRDVSPSKAGLRATIEQNGYKMPTTEDYTNSGWERGHMVPAEDFDYSQYAYSSTFFMANIWPQNENCNNPGAWYVLERYARDLAIRYNRIEVWIEVTEFSNRFIGREFRLISVPLYFRKIFYYNNKRESFRVPNTIGTPRNIFEVKNLLMEE
jgi:hypothetical protein